MEIRFTLTRRRCALIRTLSKPRRRRQRGHGKTKDTMGRTIAQHVRFLHFWAFLCKTTTWHHHNLRRLRTETATANYFNFYLELGTQRFFDTKCWGWGVAPYETVNTCSHFWNSYHRQKFLLLWRCRPDCLRSLTAFLELSLPKVPN